MKKHACRWAIVAIGWVLMNLQGLAQSSYEPDPFATLVGEGFAGSADGAGSAASIDEPSDVVDTGSFTIRKGRPVVFGPADATYAFRSTDTMNVARRRHTATLLPGGKVLVAGGYGGTDALSSAEVFNPVIEKWTTAKSMRLPRAGHTATLLADGKVLVTGGYNETGALASTELYDPVVDSWTVAASMIGARTFHTVTLLQDGQLLAAGGGDYVSFLTSAELYDPVKGAWRKTGSLHYARGHHTSTLLPGGQVLVVGGYGDDDEGAELYEPSTGSWLETGWMSDGRSQHTATLLPDGQVLVAGGDYDGEVQEVSRASAELYNAAAGSWTRTGSMLPFAPGGPVLGRSGHTATLLPNGVVLAVGGRYFVGTLTHSKSEKYDPATGKWTWAEAMSVRREYHTATLLTGGQVLIVGGFDRGTQETYASAELYELQGASGPGSPIQLTDLRIRPDGSLQFSFTNTPGSTPVILATPNLMGSGNWSPVGDATESSPGRFDFIDTQATNHPTRFYRAL